MVFFRLKTMGDKHPLLIDFLDGKAIEVSSLNIVDEMELRWFFSILKGPDT